MVTSLQQFNMLWCAIPPNGRPSNAYVHGRHHHGRYSHVCTPVCKECRFRQQHLLTRYLGASCQGQRSTPPTASSNAVPRSTGRGTQQAMGRERRHHRASGVAAAPRHGSSPHAPVPLPSPAYRATEDFTAQASRPWKGDRPQRSSAFGVSATLGQCTAGPLKPGTRPGPFRAGL